MPNTARFIRSEIQNSINTQRGILQSLIPQISHAAALITNALKEEKKILFFGNGGSASDAQHLAAEFVCRYEQDRRPLPAIALTTDTSILTAVSNDYAFSRVFARQIEALGEKGDVAIGISTSGNSDNVIEGIEVCKTHGLKTIALTGKTGGRLRRLADVVLLIPSESTARIQEAHILVGHLLCKLVEQSFLQERS